MDAAFGAVPFLHSMAMPPQDGVQAGWRMPYAAVWLHNHRIIWEFPSGRLLFSTLQNLYRYEIQINYSKKCWNLGIQNG